MKGEFLRNTDKEGEMEGQKDGERQTENTKKLNKS
jgi:hypothetical protein